MSNAFVVFLAFLALVALMAVAGLIVFLVFLALVALAAVVAFLTPDKERQGRKRSGEYFSGWTRRSHDSNDGNGVVIENHRIAPKLLGEGRRKFGPGNGLDS